MSRPIALAVTLVLAIATGLSAQPVDGVVERPDVTLHYRVHGSRGPVAVILAGGPGGSNTMLQPIADHLAGRFRCVMLEQRGTGRSRLERYDERTISFDAYIADIEAVRSALKQDRIILVGSSWGMTLAFAYAGAHPDRVLAVATIGSGTITQALERAWDDNLQLRLSDDQKRRVQEINGRDLTPDEGYVEWFRIVSPAYFYSRDAAARFTAQIRVGDLNGRVPGPAGRMMKRVEEYTVDRMPRITAPVLVIHGRQDLAPEETAFIVKERVKNAKIVFIDRCGHVPWVDQPQETWRHLDGFLKPFEAGGV